ncbi:MAG: hypothetical protein RL186_1829 [Pseudomonadota bacterium]|jgi:hypothetical protein
MAARALLLLCWALVATAPAHAQTRDYCALLTAKPEWVAPLKTASVRWDVSQGAILAIIDQESRFQADARGAGANGPNPARNFGYTQANLRTWDWYLRDTGQSQGARTDFALATDFIGWHISTTHKRLGLARDQIDAHYLVYKLGEGGYRRGPSPSATALAKSLAIKSNRASQQLTTCPIIQQAHPSTGQQATN